MHHIHPLRLRAEVQESSSIQTVVLLWELAQAQEEAEFLEEGSEEAEDSVVTVFSRRISGE